MGGAGMPGDDEILRLQPIDLAYLSLYGLDGIDDDYPVVTQEEVKQAQPAEVAFHHRHLLFIEATHERLDNVKAHAIIAKDRIS
jgi:hypothetical protein